MTWLAILLLAFTSLVYPAREPGFKTPLSEYSAAWNNPRFLTCNTAADASYLSEEEKELIYIFNMMRMDPKLFSNTVVRQYPKKRGIIYLETIAEYRSLLVDVAQTKPLPLLYPDKALFESAKCHAVSSGQKAYVGHVRQTEECKKNKRFDAECCDYGRYHPLDILMGLLIDEGVPGLGHRLACLDTYKWIGVSIQPHKSYGRTAVLDFGW